MSLPKKRLLLLSVTLGRGGAEKHLVRLANELRDRYEVHIAVVCAGGSYESGLADEIQLHHIGSRLVRVSTLAACYRAASSLARLIDQINPTCVFSFLPPVAYACHRARKKCSHAFKHVIAIQNNMDPDLDPLNGFLRRSFRQGVYDAISDADNIVAISNGVAKSLFEQFPDLSRCTRTIYNAAIDPEEQHPILEASTPVRKSDSFEIVACGRLTEQKGFCDLLDAFRMVRDREKAHLRILGTGPLRDSLLAQAARLGVQEDVEFLGFQSRPLNYFAEADLFVLSSWWEGFGNVIVEAMSVGTPVVSTDCPYGPAEIIEPGKSGLLAPPRCPEQLAEQMIAVMKDPELQRTLSVNGIVRSKSFYASVIADQYAEFIEELTEST